MKRLMLLLVTTAAYLTASSQFVARMEVKEPIPGVCDAKEVYVMLPGFKGQKEAVCPVTKEAILQRLNAEVTFLRDKPDYNDKGMVGLVINCKDELVQCRMDNKTQFAVLDAQIEAVYHSLGEWKSGKLNGKKVDTSRLFSFKIINGKFTFD